MTGSVSTSRLYALRCMYLINLALVGSGVVAAFVHRTQPWEPVPGVAYAFWAALALLSALGLRYPVAMLPLLFMQLLYKLLWLGAVFLPLHAAGRSTGLLSGMLFGAALDLAVIPWAYVLARFVRLKGDPWRATPRQAVPSEENAA